MFLSFALPAAAETAPLPPPASPAATAGDAETDEVDPGPIYVENEAAEEDPYDPSALETTMRVAMPPPLRRTDPTAPTGADTEGEEDEGKGEETLPVLTLWMTLWMTLGLA